MPTDPAEKRAFAALLLAAVLMFGFRLGATGLWAPDEPRFAEVAEELRAFEHGVPGLVVLHLNGRPYTQKPPLYYWIAAALGSATGHVSEFAARLPSALAGIACVWLTALLGRAATRNARVGLLSGALLLTVFRFAHLARRAQLDVILTAFVGVAIYAFFRWQRSSGGRGRWLVLLHGALGLAVLTKGPVGLLPLVAFALVLAWQGRLAELRRAVPLWSFGLSLGPVLVWLGLAVALTPAGFFQSAVVDNVFARFFSGTAHVRSVFYYFAHFPLEFLPWSLCWPWVGAAVWRNTRRDAPAEVRDGARLLVTWVLVSFVFFSLSAGKRGLYLLPSFPATAILCAIYLDEWLERCERVPRIAWLGLAALAVAALGFGTFVVSGDGFALAAWPAFRLPALFGALLATIAVASTLASAIAVARKRAASLQLAPALAGIFALELLVFAVAYPAFDGEKSPEPIARAAAESSPSGSPIAVFDHRELVGGIAYYARRPIVEVRSRESLSAFLAAGGESIIVKASKLDRVPGVSEFEVRASLRSGARKLFVIAPRASETTAQHRVPTPSRLSPPPPLER